MKILILFLLLQCSMIRYKENSNPDYSGTQRSDRTIQTPVLVIVNHNGEFFKRGNRKLTSWLYTVLPTLSNYFQTIENDLEKAELIVEIESSYISKDNPILPFVTFLTLGLIPYYEEIEYREDFRILKKTGEVVFQTNRFQKVDRWFGIIFIFHGVIGFIEDGNRNFPSESTMMRRVNENILQELKLKNF